MEEYERDITAILNNLERTKRYLEALFSDRMLLKKALLKLMLDQGLYDMKMTKEDYESTEGYHITYVYDEQTDIFTMSIKFPQQEDVND